MSAPGTSRSPTPRRLFDLFRKAAAECENCLAAGLPIPAYEQAIKASHVFNLLKARGVISVAERQAYIGRVRDLAKGACQAWMEKYGWADPPRREGTMRSLAEGLALIGEAPAAPPPRAGARGPLPVPGRICG